MCGIAAFWGSTDENLIKQAISKIEHRGPDGRGTYITGNDTAVLGHQRLSIIDPEGGRQPIVSGDGARALVANGMIYNYRALRDELGDAPFRTNSDSETILHACAEDGADAVSSLDGMFAFVMVDGEELIAARDPIGIKPLYLGRRDGALCFASEIKALLGVAEDIEEFPAGHLYRSGSGFEPYYEVPQPHVVQRPLSRVIDELRTTLESAVVKRLRSDVPLGAFLSGGLDSSIIAALARRHVDELHTFAVGVEGSADLEAARRVASHLDTVHHEYALTEREVYAQLPAILNHLETYDQDLVRSAVPCYFVSRLAAEHVKVVLTGEGADELFAGYKYYLRYADPHILGQELRRSITSMHNVNLQRVDRMTMAHGLEARVPFLDTAMIALGMGIDPALKLRHHEGRRVEKWILRKAFEDLLPHDIVWRVKEQFDEGSGMSDMLARTAGREGGLTVLDPDKGHAMGCRSREESFYRKLLADGFDDPEPVLNLVAHWADRPAPDDLQSKGALSA